MLVAQGADDHQSLGGELDHAVALLSQQVWCWGRDVLRSEGNWLVEIGFERFEPPFDREDSSSVYQLEIPEGRFLVLRPFGVFYGHVEQGGVYLPRYDFRPKYTKHVPLSRPIWSDKDLPKLDLPTNSQRSVCVSLTLELIDWIADYEVNIVEKLGIAYRRSTLVDWNNGKRPFTPAEKFATAWRELSIQVAANFDAYSTSCKGPTSGD